MSQVLTDRLAVVAAASGVPANVVDSWVAGGTVSRTRSACASCANVLRRGLVKVLVVVDVVVVVVDVVDLVRAVVATAAYLTK